MLAIPLERDEGEFAYGGQLMLQGIPPYKLFYNMKFPGIYAAFAAIMFFCGQTPSTIHFGLLLVNVACILLLYLLARHFLDVPGAVAAGASYALLSTSPAVLGLAAHATHFVVAAALSGFLLLLRGQDSGKPVLFFCSGLLLGMACLMKQPGAMFGLFGFCLLVAGGARQKGLWRVHCRRIGLFSIGLAAPLALTAGILWQAGVFKRFWFWTIVYPKVHASSISWSVALRNLTHFFQASPLAADGLFWIASLLGLGSLALFRGKKGGKSWMIGFLGFSGAAVFLPKFFFRHYFVMLLPALCLFVGQAISAATQWAKTRKACKAWLVVISGLFIFIWAHTVFHYRSIFFDLSPDAICRQIYGGNPFVEAVQIGHFLREHSAPDARVAVLGSEPEILFYAGRRSATGYIYMYDFFEPQPYAGEMQLEMIAQIEDVKPEYLVYVIIPISWAGRPDLQRTWGSPVMTWSPTFVKDFYDLVGLVTVNGESEYYWGKDALDRSRTDGHLIGIYKRK
ncbi:MAG: ArnT family glycosyltransferase [Limisphaerales bacterium]